MAQTEDTKAKAAEAEAPKLHISDEPDDVTGQKTATVTQEVPINSSSTYPGRDEDLKATDGKLNTVIDLARRAKFAGSQTPAVVADAGLTSDSGEITVDDAGLQADARSEHERATAEANQPSSKDAGAFAPNPEPSDDQKRSTAESKRMMKG